MPRKFVEEFIQIETKGKENFHKVPKFWNTSAANYLNGMDTAMSPYTPFIPMEYLNRGRTFTYYNPESRSLNSSWMSALFPAMGRPTSVMTEFRNSKSRLIRSPELIYSIIFGATQGSEAEYIKSSVLKSVNDYLKNDNPHGMEGALRDMISNNTAEMSTCFNSPTIRSFFLRTYNGGIGNYCLFRDTDAGRIYHILPVILPEHLYYQRMHILIKGTIDMSKVIILVDRDLEDTDSHVGVRKLYLGRLKSQLLESGAQIWAVPRECIHQLCFVQDYKVQSKKIIDRQREIESMGKMFKHYVESGLLDMNILYKPPIQVQPAMVMTGTAKVPEVLVAAVEPTSLLTDRFYELIPDNEVSPGALMTALAEGELQSQVEALSTLVDQTREQLMTVMGERVPQEEIAF